MELVHHDICILLFLLTSCVYSFSKAVGTAAMEMVLEVRFMGSFISTEPLIIITAFDYMCLTATTTTTTFSLMRTALGLA